MWPHWPQSTQTANAGSDLHQPLYRCILRCCKDVCKISLTSANGNGGVTVENWIYLYLLVCFFKPLKLMIRLKFKNDSCIKCSYTSIMEFASYNRTFGYLCTSWASCQLWPVSVAVQSGGCRRLGPLSSPLAAIFWYFFSVFPSCSDIWTHCFAHDWLMNVQVFIIKRPVRVFQWLWLYTVKYITLPEATQCLWTLP